ncbi:MAG: S9 family peptidase, partial [Gemmatimonadota bacterium]|nr:S9 family peptidase [Gemmatimonadota bacterium]
MRMRTAFSFLLTAVTITAFGPPGVRAQSQGLRTVSLEMYLDLESVSNPQISPDGTEIVYTRGWVDKMNDRRESSIWIMNEDGSRNRFLVDGSAPFG